MTIYEYLCPDCGPFEARLPLGTAPPGRDCAKCRRTARRVFSTPNLARTSPLLASARAREERGREAPEVVTAPAAQKRRPPPAHPMHARLPRP
jgi:putative FmdB family regulatory protein